MSLKIIALKGGEMDKETLEGWLEGQPREIAIAVAVRASLRVFPLLESLLSHNENQVIEFVLPTIHANAVAWFMVAFDACYDKYVKKCAKNAYDAVVGVNVTAHGLFGSGHTSVITSSIFAVYSCYVDQFYSMSATSVWHASRAYPQIWDSVKKDINFLQNNTYSQLMNEHLWFAGVPSNINDSWLNMKKRLKNRKGECWQVWTKWYDARLDPSGENAVYNPPDKGVENQRIFIVDNNLRFGYVEANCSVQRIIEEVERNRLPSRDSNLPIISDAPNQQRDHLARAGLALLISAKINKIWDMQEEYNINHQYVSPGFLIHIDSPWGGGKTTFAAMVGAVLERWRTGISYEWMEPLGLDNEREWPLKWRRPWCVAWYNAWQHEHIDPPWWSFYETVYHQIVQQIDAQTENIPSEMFLRYYYPEKLNRIFRVLRIRFHEFFGRLRLNGSAWPLVTFIVSSLVFVFLSIQFNNSSLTTLAKGLGGAAAITALLWGLPWKLLRLFRPGSPDGDGHWYFGVSDPYNRIRDHFRRLMELVDVPVLVVIDDLDRCNPQYVVDLLRGIQTILTSHRVIFMILGDRDWIERAFSVVYDDMKYIDVGSEHEFGGRFVEKTIQLSIVLPEITEKVREHYVSKLLISKYGEDNKIEKQGISERGILSSPEEVGDILNRVSVAKTPKEREREFIKAIKELEENEKSVAVIRFALRNISNDQMENLIEHELKGLASVLPSNPRQIKRIINHLSILQEIVRLLDPNKHPFGHHWYRLARWVVLMIEWPRTWVTLSRNPDLLNKIHSKQDLPEGMRLDEQAKRLITGEGLQSPWNKPITKEDLVNWLLPAIPPTSGRPWEL